MARHTKLKVIKAYLETDGKCWICGRKLTLEFDNSKTMLCSTATEYGVIVVCKSCAMRKKVMSLEDYRIVLSGYKKYIYYGEKIKRARQKQ